MLAIPGILACPITLVPLLARGVVILRGERKSPSARAKGCAFLLGAALLGVYAWGLTYIVGAVVESEDGGTGSSPSPPCRTGEQWQVENVTGHSVSYLPLRFECHVDKGASYSTTVPEYVNPALLGCAVLTFASATAALCLPRTRPEERHAPA
ncbi:hypothetical protein ACSNOK_11030 [Streptomyces sp. URMC 126]|uniref:hypothetical protein n=1 Tax=Streptomyces sp. URMC 126 TaxID=3423401 RepID=UPI003F1ADC3D